jgi:hypothetical protein
MIAPVGLSADALTDTCGYTGSRLTAMHRELAEVLLAHGQLVFADAEAEEYFRECILALGEISPTAAKYWDGVLQHGRLAHAKPHSATPLERMIELSELIATWDGIIHAALLEPERAEALGAPAGSISWRPPGGAIEIANHDAGPASETFADLRRLDATRAIRKGADRDAVWDERLGPLVRAAANVHILDRYLGSNLMAHYRRNPDRLPAELSEAEWLLQRVARDGESVRVSIYTQYRAGDGERLVTAAFRGAVRRVVRGNSGIEEIRLFAIPASSWQPHDRHLRADNAGIELSAGFDRLREASTVDAFTMTYMYAADVGKLVDEENAVRRELGGPPVVLL